MILFETKGKIVGFLTSTTKDSETLSIVQEGIQFIQHELLHSFYLVFIYYAYKLLLIRQNKCIVLLILFGPTEKRKLYLNLGFNTVQYSNAVALIRPSKLFCVKNQFPYFRE